MTDKIVMYDSDEAASFKTGLSGWVSRQGGYYGASEAAARYAGCTHVACKDCGDAAQKGYTCCIACRDKRSLEHYLAMPVVEWDGKAMLYSDTTDTYFSDLASAYELADDDGVAVEDLRLIICVPNYVSPLEDDYCVDELPEDGDLPCEVRAAMDAFNAAVKGIVLSWSPGKTRPALE